MRQTLFYIPQQVAGVPLLGVGILLALLIVASVVGVWIAWRRGRMNDVWGQAPLVVVLGLLVTVILPRIAEESGLPVRGFGVALLAAVMSGVWLAVVRARRRNVDPEVIYSLAVWLFIGGIVAARAFYVIEYWPQFRNEDFGSMIGAILRVDQGGLVVYGAFGGALAALALFVRRHRLPMLPLLDLIVPSMLLGLALGRVGCFLNGCCYGGVCELPWGVEFPANSPPYIRQIERGLMYGIQVGPRMHAGREDPQTTIVFVVPHWSAASQGVQVGDRVEQIDGHEAGTLDEAVHRIIDAAAAGREIKLKTERGTYALTPSTDPIERSLPIHPTQLYSVFDALLILFFLLAYEPFSKRDGELLAWTLSIYPVTRFLIEMIRTDESAVFGTGLSISQNISVALLLAAGGLWWYLRRQPPHHEWPAGT